MDILRFVRYNSSTLNKASRILLLRVNLKASNALSQRKQLRQFKICSEIISPTNNSIIKQSHRTVNEIVEEK